MPIDLGLAIGAAAANALGAGVNEYQKVKQNQAQLAMEQTRLANETENSKILRAIQMKQAGLQPATPTAGSDTSFMPDVAGSFDYKPSPGVGLLSQPQPDQDRALDSSGLLSNTSTSDDDSSGMILPKSSKEIAQKAVQGKNPSVSGVKQADQAAGQANGAAPSMGSGMIAPQPANSPTSAIPQTGSGLLGGAQRHFNIGGQDMEETPEAALERQSKLQSLQKGIYSNDANSDRSKNARDQMKQIVSSLGLPTNVVSDSMSEADINENKPFLIEAMKAKATQMNKEPTYNLERSAKIDKMAGDLKKDLDPDVGRAGNFGDISKRYLSGQRLKALATDANGNINNLTSAQQEELAIGAAQMLGNGSMSDSMIKNLVPSSAQGDMKKVISWVANNPQGTDQQKFTQVLLNSIDREENLAKQQMQQIQGKRLSAHSQLKKLDPDTYNSIISEYGLNANGKPITQSPPPPASTAPSAGKGMLNRPKTVTQNGYTYTLNPNTGEYE